MSRNSCGRRYRRLQKSADLTMVRRLPPIGDLMLCSDGQFRAVTGIGAYNVVVSAKNCNWFLQTELVRHVAGNIWTTLPEPRKVSA